MRILLMGNPNVGKSVIFSQLTGVNVIASNYPGTTVEYSKGILKTGRSQMEIIDVPGTYSLEGSCEAEKVATRMLSMGDAVINVVDATNLERNLNLTLQLLETGIPMIVLLNFWDETKHKGIDIDAQKLQEFLQVPVIPTVGISGKGLKECVNKLDIVQRRKPQNKSRNERWQEIGTIIEQVQAIKDRRHTYLELLQDASVHPISGIIIAIIVLYTALRSVLFIGETVITRVTEPLFETFYEPVLMELSNLIISFDVLHSILIGAVSDSGIDFEGSLGLLSTGIFVPIGIVLPYIFAFYLVLGFLEDLGYLPRLAVLLDKLMHKLGMHGFSIIPMILGAGCNVPGALAMRNLGSRREKFIASTLMAVSIPCMAQIALIVGLVGRNGPVYLTIVFGALFTVWAVLGLFIDRVSAGYTPSILLEIPAYRLPGYKAQIKKLGMRMRAFLTEGLLHVLGGILFINILYTTGIVALIAEITQPVITGIFGLPGDAVSALLVGFLRKDVAIVMLEPLGLTAVQMVIASVVLAVYFPCAATFSILIREIGFMDMFKAGMIMLGTAIIAGGTLNLILERTLPANYVAVSLFVVPITLLLFIRGKSDNEEDGEVFNVSEDSSKDTSTL